MQCLRMFHGQRIDVPASDRLPGQSNTSGDSFALAPQYRREVDPSGVLNQNVKTRFLAHRQRHGVLTQAPVQSPHQFAVEIDLRIIVQIIERQLASHRSGKFRSIEDVSIRLVEVFHRQRPVRVHRLGQRVPERRRFGEGNAGTGSVGFTCGTAEGATPVALPMASRKAWYFAVGRPLSSSAES